ncbi:unnamed protein product [Schistocephalus solidus]|uniref:TPX2 domain-containing protein n=1 Tax=Schistocephalus solidus TaxID=70667 RepID=A0A183SYM1_SCHSO|nr:unnamed protein product [Schistocephalus solidus]
MPIAVKFGSSPLKNHPSRASLFNKDAVSTEYAEPTEVCMEAYRSIDSVHFRHNYNEFKNASYLGIQRLERRRRELLNTTYFCVNHPSHMHEARFQWKKRYEQEMDEACIRRREKKETDNYIIKLPAQCLKKRVKKVAASPVSEKFDLPMTPRMVISKSLPSTPRTMIHLEKSVEKMFVSAERALNQVFAAPPPNVFQPGALLQKRTALISPRELLQDLE